MIWNRGFAITEPEIVLDGKNLFRFFPVMWDDNLTYNLITRITIITHKKTFC